MTRNALTDFFTEKALKTVVRANVWQDRPRNQFGHDYIHFDGSAFEAGLAYIRDQEQLIINAIQKDEMVKARKAFGQITHTWQDFYSHSNYVPLWLQAHPNAAPEGIDPSDPAILNSPELHSGVNYGLIEFISMIPPFSKWIIPKMPADSHARMNMDGPEASPLFPFGIAAGQKRTTQLFQELLTACEQESIPQALIDRFLGRDNDN
jgi:hypothetical protein